MHYKGILLLLHIRKQQYIDMSFKEVDLASWDCNKVTIGKGPNNGGISILYEGKIPILKLCPENMKNGYLVSSFHGLQRNMKYDKNSKSFTDTWEGDWSISFTIASVVKDVEEENGLRLKIMNIFKDIENKVKAAYDKAPSNPLNYTYITEINAFGVEKKLGINPDKGCYLKVKVGYTASPNAKTFEKDGKFVPVLEERRPKATFYDITKAADQMVITNPDIECRTGMSAVPKFVIGISVVNEVIYITKRLLDCYYKPTNMGGNGPDEELISMLRENLIISDDN